MKPEALVPLLKPCLLFNKLDHMKLLKLASSLQYHLTTYQKGVLLFLRGDKYTKLSIIIKGQVKAQMQSYAGKTVTIETLKAPDPIASAILFSTNNLLPVQVVAIDEVQTLTIPRQELLRIFNEYPVVLEAFLQDMGGRLSILSEKHRLSHFSTIREKVAGFLLDQSLTQKSNTIILPYTKEVLSELFGVTRPALSRVFSQLEAEGTLRASGKKVSINKELLTEELEED